MKKVKLFLSIMSVIVSIIGTYLVVIHGGWWLWLGIFLLIYANNLERNLR